MKPVAQESPLLSYLSLFTSFGTLLCCALPSLLVLFGLGATVATVLSSAPWLVGLSRQKHLVFGISGVLMAANVVYLYVLAPRLRAQGVACAPDMPDTCNSASRMSQGVLWASAIVYIVGFFTAYLLGPVLTWFADL